MIMNIVRFTLTLYLVLTLCASANSERIRALSTTKQMIKMANPANGGHSLLPSIIYNTKISSLSSFGMVLFIQRYLIIHLIYLRTIQYRETLQYVYR